MNRKIFQAILIMATLGSFNLHSLTLEITKPTENQKIILPNVPVQAQTNANFEIKWETTVGEKTHKTTTKSGQQGAITVSPFPNDNTGFGPKSVKATIEDTTPPNTQITSASIKNAKKIITITGIHASILIA